MLKLKLIAPVLFVSAFAIVMSETASAQTTAQPDELQAIYACKSISNARERLACYDNSVGRFEAAEKSGEVVTVSKTQIEKVKRDAFGFNLPSLPSLGRIFGGNGKSDDKPEKENDLTAPVKQAERVAPATTPTKPPALERKSNPDGIKEVTLNIRKTTEFGYKKTRFFMSNGQVWEQADSIKVRIPKIRNGKQNTAEISKAALGSFLMKINGKGAAIRVRRVR